jgi:hypothetical protein
MKRQKDHWSVKIFIFIICLVLTAACSKKEEKEEPQIKRSTDAWVVDANEDDGVARIKYASADPNATYKCMIVRESDILSGTWQDCPANGIEIPVDGGVKYVFKVKAIVNGKEEGKPYTHVFVSQTNIKTQIITEQNITSTYTLPTLSVQFGIEGTDEINNYEYQCMRENETAFSLCPDQNTYDFSELIDGGHYTLTVQALHKRNGAKAKSASLSFDVKLAEIEVTGQDQLENSLTGIVDLEFVVSAQNVECSLIGQTSESASDFEDCTNGYQIPLDRMQSGPYSLIINARNRNGQTVANKVIHFCARSCETIGQAVEPVLQSFQVGSFYEFAIPEGMHVTEYATTKTYNNSLSFYRVMSDSDPHYIGNYSCDRLFDRKIQASTPAGEILDYCHSTPTSDLYKWLSDYRLANNHIEVATDHDIIQQDQFSHERIMINVFDRDYEFMRSRSRFEQLCMNRIGAISHTPAIALVQDFWLADELRAEFWMCDTSLVGSGLGLPGSEEWRIGAFFIVHDGDGFPDLACSENCNYKNPSLLEVVYMARPNTSNWVAEVFARTAQERLLPNLRRIQP